MNELSALNQSLLLGINDLEEMLCRVARPEENFPAYNLVNLDENNLLISLAVAGYTPDDLNVTIDDRELVIRGKQSQVIEQQYLHKGIAARSFIKTFLLADGMKAGSVTLEYGILNIVLRKPPKKHKKQTLQITCAPHLNIIETKAKHK